jgi:hypothetical protein
MIEVKNQNCDYDDNILGCDDSTVYVIYYKNKSWHLYCGGEVKKQEDYDDLVQEVMDGENVSRDNIKLTQPISINFKEISAEDLLNSKLQKQKAAAKKKIAALKKKFGI